MVHRIISWCSVFLISSRRFLVREYLSTEVSPCAPHEDSVPPCPERRRRSGNPRRLEDVALRDAEKEALSIDLYDASFLPENDHHGLYPWETDWFERRLPSPPASILIGAAGGGREAAALRDLGYQVRAFEPSASAFRRGAFPGRIACSSVWRRAPVPPLPQMPESGFPG